MAIRTALRVFGVIDNREPCAPSNKRVDHPTATRLQDLRVKPFVGHLESKSNRWVSDSITFEGSNRGVLFTKRLRQNARGFDNELHFTAMRRRKRQSKASIRLGLRATDQ